MMARATRLVARQTMTHQVSGETTPERSPKDLQEPKNQGTAQQGDKSVQMKSAPIGLPGLMRAFTKRKPFTGAYTDNMNGTINLYEVNARMCPN